MKNATILRLASILLILTLMIGMIPAASASNEVYFPVYMGNSSSIVDALRSLDIDPSYQNRERIAAANGIPGYTGTASQNTELLEKLRAGILIDPNGKSTVSNNQDVLGSPYYPTCEENFTSIVDALNSIGVDASFDFRCKIAEANGIEDYAGSAEQNLYMLDLLKSNRLCRPEAEVLSSVADHSEPALTLTGNVGDLSSASVLLDVKKSNAPIRSGAGSKYAVIARCSDAAVLASSGSCRNGSFRKWYKVDLDGETGYIYSGNVSVHKHNEQELHINGVIYGVCNCGMVTAKASNGKSIGEATKVMGSLTLALPLAAADGPLPIGDIAFAVIAVIALDDTRALRDLLHVLLCGHHGADDELDAEQQCHDHGEIAHCNGWHKTRDKASDNGECQHRDHHDEAVADVQIPVAAVGIGRDGACQHIGCQCDADGRVRLDMQKCDEHGGDDGSGTHSGKARAEAGPRTCEQADDDGQEELHRITPSLSFRPFCGRRP